MLFLSMSLKSLFHKKSLRRKEPEVNEALDVGLVFPALDNCHDVSLDLVIAVSEIVFRIGKVIR